MAVPNLAWRAAQPSYLQPKRKGFLRGEKSKPSKARAGRSRLPPAGVLGCAGHGTHGRSAHNILAPYAGSAAIGARGPAHKAHGLACSNGQPFPFQLVPSPPHAGHLAGLPLPGPPSPPNRRARLHTARRPERCEHARITLPLAPWRCPWTAAPFPPPVYPHASGLFQRCVQEGLVHVVQKHLGAEAAGTEGEWRGRVGALTRGRWHASHDGMMDTCDPAAPGVSGWWTSRGALDGTWHRAAAHGAGRWRHDAVSGAMYEMQQWPRSRFEGTRGCPTARPTLLTAQLGSFSSPPAARVRRSPAPCAARGPPGG